MPPSLEAKRIANLMRQVYSKEEYNQIRQQIEVNPTDVGPYKIVTIIFEDFFRHKRNHQMRTLKLSDVMQRYSNLCANDTFQKIMSICQNTFNDPRINFFQHSEGSLSADGKKNFKNLAKTLHSVDIKNAILEDHDHKHVASTIHYRSERQNFSDLLLCDLSDTELSDFLTDLLSDKKDDLSTEPPMSLTMVTKDMFATALSKRKIDTNNTDDEAFVPKRKTY